MESYFRELSEKLCAGVAAGEVLLLNYQGEDTDFVRLNMNKVRQAGQVRQQTLHLDLIINGREKFGFMRVADHIFRFALGGGNLPDLILQVHQAVAGRLYAFITVLHGFAVMGLKGCKTVHQRMDSGLDKRIIQGEKIALAFGHLFTTSDD